MTLNLHGLLKMICEYFFMSILKVGQADPKLLKRLVFRNNFVGKFSG